ncbi:MAG: hypothetical protein RR144_01640 [Clostridia bacterium]
MLDKKIVNVVEHYLKLFPYIEQEIRELQEDIEMPIHRDVNSFIQSKNKVSRMVENQAINNVQISEKISKCRKWQEIIEEVIERYRKNQVDRYLYMKLKYFKKYSINAIETELTFGKTMQDRLRQDVVDYLALFAVKENLIKL